MSFPVDDFGMNIRAEVKAYNFGFSTAKNLASVIRANDKVTVVTFALPTHACFRPNGLGICPQNVTIIGNSRYADQALELKQAYPELRIFLDPRIHAKMTLASSGKVWLGSANMAMSNSLDSTIGIESPAVYATQHMILRKRTGLRKVSQPIAANPKLVHKVPGDLFILGLIGDVKGDLPKILLCGFGQPDAIAHSSSPSSSLRISSQAASRFCTRPSYTSSAAWAR